MKFALLLLLYATSAASFSLFEADGDKDNTCFNDGYQSGSKCVCKDLVGGDLCNDWQCINYGVPTTDDDELYTCACPRGFIGTHCEPVACVEGLIQNSASVGHSLSLVLMLNDHINSLVNTVPDNIAEGILSIFNPNPSNLDTLFVRFLGAQSGAVNADPITNDFKNNLNEEISDFAFYYSPLNMSKLTFNDINQIVLKSYSHSPVLIVTDVGLVDFNDTSAYQEVLLAAVARQIEINVIVISSMSYAYDIYFDPTYTPLRNLADATLGSFISPYPTLGPPFDNLGSEVITTVGKLLLGKTVIATGEFSNNALLTFKARKEVDFTEFVYIAVYANDVAASNASIEIQNLLPGNTDSFDKIIDAGPWKLFSSSLAVSQPTYLAMLKTSLTAGSYKIWATAKNPPHVSLGYATDDLTDAHSPLPVAGVHSTIVAHVDNLVSNLSLSSTIYVNGTSSTTSSEARNCLFELKLGTINCPEEGATGTIVVKSDLQSFQETLPIACSTTKLNQKKRIYSSDDDKKLRKRLLLTGDSDSSLQCTDSNTIKLNPTAPRTFAFVLSNTQNLGGQFVNAPYNSLIVALQNYSKSYASNFYGKYSLLTFGNDESVNKILVADSISSFTTNLVTAVLNPVEQTTCSSQTDQYNVLKTVFDNVNNFTEVFYVTDSELNIQESDLPDLYERANKKHIKLTFLVYSGPTCSPNTTINSPFYDLAIRTSGNVVPFTNITSITDFFNNYQGQENSQVVTTKLDKNAVIGNVATPPFLYKNTSRYVISGTALPGSNPKSSVIIKNEMGSTISSIDISGDIIGTKYFTVDFPSNLTEGYYTVQLFVLDFLNGTYFNVRQVWDETSDYSVIAFTNSNATDATSAIPSFLDAKYLYLVANASTNGSISIINADGSLIKQAATEERKVCSYQYILPDYQWLCTIPNAIYYIKYETADYTHTTTFNCISSGSDLTCQNGGSKNSTDSCICPIGFEGSTCGDIVCFNDGEIQDDNTCLCTDNYEGKHCEIAKASCSLQPSQLHYTSAFETLILAIDTTNTALLTKIQSTEFPQQFRRYILAVTTIPGSPVLPVQIFDGYDNFKQTLTSLVAFDIDIDIKPPLKDALSAVTTDRPLLIWVSNSGPLTEFEDIKEIRYLIAKTRAEVRSFTKTLTSAYLSIATLGNGIPNVVSNFDNFEKIPYYVDLITPTIASDSPSNSLVTFDYYLGTNCSGRVINFDSSIGSAYITLFNYAYTDANVVAPNVYNISSTITVSSIDGAKQCGYMIEYQSSPRIAYSYTSSKNYETEGFVVPLSDDVSILNFALEDVDLTDDYSKFPVASTSPLKIEEFEYQFSPVLKKDCTYPWGVEIQCNVDGPLKVKIQTRAYTQVLTAYCSDDVKCGVNGTKLDKGGCACDPGWSGSDCKTPSCLNGGTAYATACVCNENYYGTNCEFSVNNPNPDRNIIILLDVVEEHLLENRKQLITDFVNTYQNLAKYAFATNTANNSSYSGLTGNYTSILSLVNKSSLSNGTIDLDSPLAFFDNINVTNNSLSVIFYITNTKPPVGQSLTTVNALQEKGVYIFSAYYSGNDSVDIATVNENALLGGVTASSSSYEIIQRFQNALQGGASVTATTPNPSQTTTSGPQHACVYDKTYDILVFLNTDVTKDTDVLKIKELLYAFGNDVNFGPRTDSDYYRYSRVTLGNIQATLSEPYPTYPNVFCATSHSIYDTSINQTSFKVTENTPLNYTIAASMLYDLFNQSAPKSYYRSVPHVLITVSTATNILDVDNVANVIKSYQTSNTNLISVTVGVGDGDFTYLKKLSPNVTDTDFGYGLFVPFNDSVSAVTGTIYDSLCEYYNEHSSEFNDEYKCAISVYSAEP